MSVLPKKLIPIVFIPGIMGSNLRMNAARQAEMGRSNNISWRPDNAATNSVPMLWTDAADRQRAMDPLATEVDAYDPQTNPTGNAKETSDARHSKVANLNVRTPLLSDDSMTSAQRKTKEQKARERGWGEVFFSSYRTVLEMCEQRLNTAFSQHGMDPWWKAIVGVDPVAWQLSDKFKLPILTEAELKDAVKGTWFPVHALGYNWAESNADSGALMASRIKRLISDYQAMGFNCEKVILVTHSMGGLVARAVVHPKIGAAQDLVLGVVHGVMPAIGAAAAYKRMRCGFGESSMDVAAKVIGNHGSEITAVLGNSPGGLQLLPSKAYGKGWLTLMHKGKVLKSLPLSGDPYAEIYKNSTAWYRLIREDWLNPAGLRTSSLERTYGYLEDAKVFHDMLEKVYHPMSFAHYGCDSARQSFHTVSWVIEPNAVFSSVDDLSTHSDNSQGALELQGKDLTVLRGPYAPAKVAKVSLTPPADPGDETVPMYSADHQLRSGGFKGVFRQTGYEHQASYANPKALHSTLYSIVRIAQTMKWAT